MSTNFYIFTFLSSHLAPSPQICDLPEAFLCYDIWKNIWNLDRPGGVRVVMVCGWGWGCGGVCLWMLGVGMVLLGIVVAAWKDGFCVLVISLDCREASVYAMLWVGFWISRRPWLPERDNYNIARLLFFKVVVLGGVPVGVRFEQPSPAITEAQTTQTKPTTTLSLPTLLLFSPTTRLLLTATNYENSTCTPTKCFSIFMT